MEASPASSRAVRGARSIDALPAAERLARDSYLALVVVVVMLSAHLPACSKVQVSGVSLPAPKVTAHRELQTQSSAVLLAASVASAPGRAVDEIIMVFSQPLDPMSIRRDRVMVVHADGARSLPLEVTLSPANERNEGHTLRLIGRFGDSVPRRVEIIAPIYTRDGASLRGASASPASPESGDLVLDARVLPVATSMGDTNCEATQSVIRLRYSDRITGVEATDLASIGIMGRDGERRAPTAFGDHADSSAVPAVPETAPAARAPSRKGRSLSGPAAPTMPSSSVPDVVLSALDDNVLDLCVPPGAEPVTLELPAGVFRDRNGVPTQHQRVLLLAPAASLGAGP